MQKRTKFPLSGIIPPMVTPLNDSDQLDIAGLERLVEHVLAGGVSGLFVLGTTGEGPSLCYRLRHEMVSRVCRQVNCRVPVLVGITDTAFVESVELARHAANAGADALVVAPPYYPPEGQPELQEYLDRLVPQLPLPLYLYNLPLLAKVSFELDTLRRAMDEPRIVGLKDSSGNMVYFHRVAGLLPRRPDWSLFIGPEELLLDAVFAGGHGGVSGGANLFPRLYVRLFEAVRAGNIPRARELHDAVMQIRDSLYPAGRHPSSIIKGLKCALSCRGVCNDLMAEPSHRFRGQQREAIEQRLSEIEDALSNLSL
ncbi:MAG TPA: dihydrodipicolinate synthase family protein [Verrucomicrobiae bacterium]|nr:dihydrodipicolinate synthase family protein [Verrucomicrobiae bacterium]